MTQVEIILAVVVVLVALENVVLVFRLNKIEKRQREYAKITVEVCAEKVAEIRAKLDERITKNRDNAKAVFQGIYSYLKIKGKTQEDGSVIFTKK